MTLADSPRRLRRAGGQPGLGSADSRLEQHIFGVRDRIHSIPILIVGLVLTICWPSFAHAEADRLAASLENTQVATLGSSASDQDYLIKVALPYSYGGSDNAYPVVYLLDSDVLFGMLTDITRLLPLEGVPAFLGRQRVPELIVVGIGYPGGVAEMSDKRGWDLNPPEGDEGEINPKGAANFYHFLSEDLIPWVETNYRAEPANRTLVGVSRAGVFVLSTLFLHPQTFQRYIAISPVIEPPIYDYLERYAKGQGLAPARLFLSAGSAGELEAGIVEGVSRLAASLRELGTTNLDWSFEAFPGESHVSVVPNALVRALVALFSEPAASTKAG